MSQKKINDIDLAALGQEKLAVQQTKRSKARTKKQTQAVLEKAAAAVEAKEAKSTSSAAHNSFGWLGRNRQKHDPVRMRTGYHHR